MSAPIVLHRLRCLVRTSTGLGGVTLGGLTLGLVWGCSAPAEEGGGGPPVPPFQAPGAGTPPPGAGAPLTPGAGEVGGAAPAGGAGAGAPSGASGSEGGAMPAGFDGAPGTSPAGGAASGAVPADDAAPDAGAPGDGAPDDGAPYDGAPDEGAPDDGAPDDVGVGVSPGGVGRAGAELCPPGPFGSPLATAPQVTKLFSVGENNFFNFEGPVWAGDALYFSEIGGGGNPPPSNINRFVPGGSLERGVLEGTGSNGLGVDAQGNLVAATHDLGAISAFQLPGGARSAIGAQTFEGQRFNSPNDLVLRSDGNVYFTDPTFQAPGNPQGATRVYRLAPDGTASVVDASLSNPNGITLSPDGSTLYATGAGRLVRYELAADGTPSAGTDVPLADQLQTPDGMTVDCAGNVYTTEHFRRLIRVIAPSGEEIGRFGGPEAFDRDITNLAFGGPSRTTLFVTSLTQDTQGGVFSVELSVPGMPY